MEAPSNEKHFVARAVIYNVLTMDLELPIEIGIFAFHEYPDEVALQYHLGQAEQAADWDLKYPKWHNYLDFQFAAPLDQQIPGQFQIEPAATKLLSKFLTVLQLYAATPIGGRVYTIRPVSRTDFTEEDVISYPTNIGGDPNDSEIYFITRDNIEAIRQHFHSLWGKDWHLIRIPVARYMHSFTRNLFTEGFEPDDAFMDLMFALDNLFGSPARGVSS